MTARETLQDRRDVTAELNALADGSFNLTSRERNVLRRARDEIVTQSGGMFQEQTPPRQRERRSLGANQPAGALPAMWQDGEE